MKKKYELVASDVEGLYRVKALRNFDNVKAGDVGGYVAGEHNLSHDGDCWVSDNACVSGDARVYGNACVSGDARIYGDACVSGNANISSLIDCFAVGPALSSGRYTTVHKTAEGYQINCGCYTTDSIKAFKKRVNEVHSGDNLSSYKGIAGSIGLWVEENVNNS